MARVNPTQFAILGLLADEDLTGYDIKKLVEERLSHFWSESFGHIYPMLRRLRERGLVEQSVERQEGRPDRKVYSITEDGRAALESWFAEPPAPQRPRNEVLLRIFLGRHANPGYLIRDVRAQREQFAHALGQLRAIKARLDAQPETGADDVYWNLTLEYGLNALEAVVDWGERAEASLSEIATTTPTGRKPPR
jgi:PadR family transcriptional regulator, regulatory protein AphA